MGKEKDVAAMEIDESRPNGSDQISNPKFSINGLTLHLFLSACISVIIREFRLMCTFFA